MKQKILNALKTTYANLGLSEKALGGVASFLEKTIADENGIDAAIKEASVAELLKVYQSEMDSERNKAAKAVKDFEDYKKAHPEQGPKNPNVPSINDDVKELIQKMEEKITSLEARNAESDKRLRTSETISKVREALKGDNCGVEPILNLILSNAEIGETDTVESLTARFKAEYQSQYKTFYGNGQIPPIGGHQNDEGYKPGKFSGVVAALEQKGLLPKDSQ